MTMKVLWITNILFPDISRELGVTPPVTGGWMKSSAQALLDLNVGVELAVATLYGKEYRKDVINGVTYYCLPFTIYEQKKYNPQLEKYWEIIAKDFCPDIVHIHGTEFPHGLAYLRAIGSDNIVVSIQGLVGAYARYSLGQIPEKELKKNRTLYDYLKGHILRLPYDMEKSGMLENEYLRMAKHVIGRTDWDRDHVWAINPNIAYHFCNETLRAPFYSHEWRIDRCERHSIFLSQAQKPIKGIHKVVEALPYIIRHYPDVKVYVSGPQFLRRISLKEKLKFDTYANYVSRMMERLGVKDRFVFTGLLDENQIAEQYKKAHVFVCPSSIENSPNSLGEAQLVGTPVVASYVGGVPNMVENGKTGLLYRFEEHEMLAKCVCSIFEDDDLATRISENERQAARARHDRRGNAMCTYEIYNKIVTG